MASPGSTTKSSSAFSVDALEALDAATRAIAGVLDLDAVLQLIVERVCALADARHDEQPRLVGGAGRGGLRPVGTGRLLPATAGERLPDVDQGALGRAVLGVFRRLAAARAGPVRLEHRFDEPMKKELERRGYRVEWAGPYSMRNAQIAGIDPVTGMRYGDLKKQVAEAVVSALEPIQKRYGEIMAERGFVAQVLANGAERVRPIAQDTVNKGKKAMGLYTA